MVKQVTKAILFSLEMFVRIYMALAFMVAVLIAAAVTILISPLFYAIKNTFGRRMHQ